MLNLGLNHLIEYTDWERQNWHEWMREHGDDALKISAGPNGDGRKLSADGIFSRYRRPISICSCLSTACFAFGYPCLANWRSVYPGIVSKGRLAFWSFSSLVNPTCVS